MSSFNRNSHPESESIFKLVSYIFFLVLVTGCANLDLIKPEAVKEKARVSESDENSPAKTSTEAAPATVIHYTDPMADKVIPLSLVKGYDLVSQRVRNKKIDSAMKLLHQLQQAHPNYSGPSYKIASLYFQQSSFEKALAAIQKSLTIDSKNYHAHNLYGILLRSTGKFQQAKAAYQKAIALFPGFSKGHLNLAILADIYLYDFKLALNHYQQYQLIEGDKERQVSGWIIDLKRRMAREG